jgi:hypothetical protein
MHFRRQSNAQNLNSAYNPEKVRRNGNSRLAGTLLYSFFFRTFALAKKHPEPDLQKHEQKGTHSE